MQKQNCSTLSTALPEAFTFQNKPNSYTVYTKLSHLTEM